MVTKNRGTVKVGDNDIAYRGSEKIQGKDLKAHIANLFQLENIGVLLGAGASKFAGGKIMAELWREFVNQQNSSAEFLEFHGFITNEQLKLPRKESEEECHGHYPNIEHLIDDLSVTIADSEREIKNFNNSNDSGSDAHKNCINFHKKALKAKSDLTRSVISAAMLNKKLWNSNTTVSDYINEKKLSPHRKLLQKITGTRQPGQSSPWVFTTNYDLAVEWSAESIDMTIINGFLGLHKRHFSPQSFDLGLRNTETRGEARFGIYDIYLVKLHGSLTWIKDSNDFYEVQSKEAKEIIDKFAKGSLDENNLVVFPSAAKYMQTTGYFFGELFRRFGQFLSKPQCALFIFGYGFNDEHINRLLKSALLNPTLQLVIYFPNFTDLEDMSDIPDSLRNLLKLEYPRVTIIGGENAYFESAVSLLPNPAIYDEPLQKLRDQLNEE